MTIAKPTELADVVAKLDSLEVQLKDFEETKQKLEKATTDLEGLTKQVDTLQEENKELKQQLADAEITLESTKAELTIANNLVDELSKTPEAEEKPELEVKAPEVALEVKDADGNTVDVVAQLKIAQEQIAELTKRIDATIEVAADAVDETDAVKEQVALVAEQLLPKGQIPVVDEAGTASAETHKTWLKLALSKNPEDRRAARLMKKQNPDIEAATKESTPAPAYSAPKTTVTAEQLAVFSQWQAILNEAKVNEKNHKLHAEKVVEARKFYKTGNNRAIIDAVIASRA